MKKYFLSAVCTAMLLLGVFAVNAQDKDTKEKPSKSKTSSGDEIIIRRKSGDNAKVIVEIKDGDVLVNGKSIEDFDDDNISVTKRKTPRMAITTPSSQFRSYGLTHDGEGDGWVTAKGNSAFLGVSTEGDDGGAKITNVNDGSAADKAGLKEDDVITKINDTKIEDQDDLTKAIGKYKPEDKVTVTYKRDGKEQKTTATLGKNKNSYSYSYSMPQGVLAPEFDFNWDNSDMHGLTYAFGGRPRLGIKAQDTEDGKGVKVLDIAEESAAAKSGIKEGDIITDFDGKKVNSADDLAEAAQDAREKTSISVKLTRDGKAQTIELKRPKKLKTTNL
jgi:serine protease Do